MTENTPISTKHRAAGCRPQTQHTVTAPTQQTVTAQTQHTDTAQSQHSHHQSPPSTERRDVDHRPRHGRAGVGSSERSKVGQTDVEVIVPLSGPTTLARPSGRCWTATRSGCW